ncbi:hypothetical protein Ancab_036765 [Ancistrocladus abbreviatus]
MATFLNSVSFIQPNISLLEAYHKKIKGYYIDDFPEMPINFYNFVNCPPNNIPNDMLRDTGTVTTENDPIHLHGYSFYVSLSAGGWAVTRFVADNPGAHVSLSVLFEGVWFMHCHLDVHLSWDWSVVLILKNGEGKMERLPHPPAALPKC